MTTISVSPSLILCAPRIIAFMPEAHTYMSPIKKGNTLFTVVQTVLSERPAPLAICLAGAWPTLALITQPKKTSSTLSAGIPARLIAAIINTGSIYRYL